MTDQDPNNTVQRNEELDVTQNDVTQEEEAEFSDRGTLVITKRSIF